MKLSQSFFYTLREDAKDEDSVSGNLLVKSGMIKKTSNGIYMYMPLGLRVLKKIENIIREEMDASGAQELEMPHLLSQEVYKESGRLDNFGQSMFKLNDRYNRPFALGPTHEELFVKAASMKIRSYKDLPFNLYQIGNKYRDEVRPRLGLIRVREFSMKDAYSFDADSESLNNSYKKMYDAYCKIFDRVGLNYKVVKADTGVMGGSLSEEFQALTDTGEDILVLCDSCDFASNIEVSNCIPRKFDMAEKLTKELKETPNAGSIDEISKYLNIPPYKLVKTLIYKCDDKFYACLVAGDRDINETKLSKLLNGEVELASFEEVENVTGAKVGFAGPINLDVKIIIDDEVLNMCNFVVGANKTDYHYINVNVSDFKYDVVADIKNIKEGDECPHCKGKIYFKKGIEVGNLFKLDTKYTEALNLQYLDQFNKLNYVYMGCYGIGVPRIMASIVEQYHDEYGIKWPISIAPYQVGIVVISDRDEMQMKYANELYDELTNNHIEVILDDRKERPGVKFKDMDLIGIPIRITIGKKINDNNVEIKVGRNEGYDIEYNNIINEIKKIMEEK
jgi:prolyl-tRNA synthetase